MSHGHDIWGKQSHSLHIVRAISTLWWHKMPFISPLPTVTEVQHSSMNKGALEGAIGSSTIHQGTQEKSHPIVHQVIGKQTLILTIDPAVTLLEWAVSKDWKMWLLFQMGRQPFNIQGTWKNEAHMISPKDHNNPPVHLPMQETWVQSLGWGDPLEKGMATHSSILDR